MALLTIFTAFCFAFYAVQISSPQYKSLITFFRGGGVKVSPRTALLLSKSHKIFLKRAWACVAVCGGAWACVGVCGRV